MNGLEVGHPIQMSCVIERLNLGNSYDGWIKKQIHLFLNLLLLEEVKQSDGSLQVRFADAFRTENGN